MKYPELKYPETKAADLGIPKEVYAQFGAIELPFHSNTIIKLIR